MVFLHLLKKIFSDRKELSTKGSKFFPIQVDTISDGAWCVEKQEATKVIFIVQMEENLLSTSSFLKIAIVSPFAKKAHCSRNESAPMLAKNNSLTDVICSKEKNIIVLTVEQ